MSDSLSIVTISFNQAEYLERAIASVRLQGVPAQYIVVDPGSTDGSRDIAEAGRDVITDLVYEPDAGPADGLNKGFARATGDVVAYLNADDSYLPGAFEKVMNYFSEHADTDVLYGDAWITGPRDERLRAAASSTFTRRRYAYGAAVVLQQSTFMRRRAFERTQGFNPANNTCWDAELLIDLAATGSRFRYRSGALACFRIYGESITGSGLNSKQYAADQLRLKKNALGRNLQLFDHPVALAARQFGRVQRQARRWRLQHRDDG